MARGDGTTTRQMQKAAHGAVFVWVHYALSYPRHLAKKIGRDDLKIVSPEFFSRDYWRGQEFSEIVIDHACYLNDEQYRNYQRAMTRVRPTDRQAME